MVEQMGSGPKDGFGLFKARCISSDGTQDACVTAPSPSVCLLRASPFEEILQCLRL